jgi:hypothetical protein
MGRALSLVMAALATASATLAADPRVVYFYSPETTINNYATLKKEFDAYLAAKGDYQFQPFSDPETFEQVSLTKTDGVWLLSSWHYQSLNRTMGEELPFDGVLVAERNGRATQRKVLSAPGSVEAAAGLTRIAAAGSEEYARDLLDHMFGEEGESVLGSVQILTVPKDLDALMAVAFGLAEAALTTESSLEKFASLNPKQHEKLKHLGSSPESLLLVLAAPKTAGSPEGGLLDVVKAMGQTPEGQEKLIMLGLDNLRTLQAPEKETLEK